MAAALPRQGRPPHAGKGPAIQKNCYACDEWSGKFFVNDNENPYTFDADKPFHWIRGRQVGGRSIMWGRQVYRWSDLDFEANAKDGHGVDWPIRYADIAPWYSYVERFIGVSGERLGLRAASRRRVPAAHGAQLRRARWCGRESRDRSAASGC